MAPEVDPVALAPDQSLRSQVELDSTDWLKVIAGLHPRLGIDISEADGGHPASVDAIVA